MAKKQPNSFLKRHKRKLGSIYHNWHRIEDFGKLANERDQFYTEKQILFDQSNDWRILLANKFLKGSGIEIGPAEHPLDVPHWAKVRYVDEMSTEQLVATYPYLKKHELVTIDVVDDGQTLAKFKNSSVDFVIANHFLEHVIDPIKTLRNFYRVLRSDGVIFMAIPDKRFTFDIQRPVTPQKRLIDFHKTPKKAEAGKWPMFIETARLIEGKKGQKNIEQRAHELQDQKFSIHLNVWTQHDLLELILYIIRNYSLDLDFETIVKNQHEVIVILKKSPKNSVPKPLQAKTTRKKTSSKKN